jgi:hypothetical protein
MVTRIFHLGFAFLFAAAGMRGQDEYLLERYDQIPVTKDAEFLQSAWAGGINAGQLSRIDLDLDGDLDLFVFDRSSDRVLTFLNADDSPGALQYRHTYEFNHRFPAMSEWALLRDFNCDGKMDIFTKAPNAIKVYENVSTLESGLQFELRAPLLYAEYNYSGVPFDAPVFCVTVDIPAIVDHDDDGDLDIFTFSEVATTVYFYKNFASEIGICDSLAYELGNRCYGFFSEGTEDNSLFLNQECPFNVIEPRSGGLHTGGTLLSMDTNNDGYNEMVIGDVSFTYLKMLVNGPSIQGPDSMVNFVADFPAGLGTDLAINMINFPSAFYEDVNNDGIRDLIAAANNPSQCEDDSSMWLYLNSGLTSLPDFDFVKRNFLQDEMLEFGRGAYPVVVDYNADGLLDIFVGNEEYYQEGPQPPSRVALLENTGTDNEPAFTLVTDNYLGLDQYNYLAMYPAFGDLDGDGDLDMLIGEQGGKLQFFRNQAGPGAIFDFVLDTPNYPDALGEAIDVGQFATPQFFDIDIDGDEDLLIGEKNGNINFYRNDGGNNTPSFVLAADTIGDAVASNYLGINGYSVPYFFRNANNETRLLIGTEKGVVNFYDNIDNNLEGTFNLVEERFGDIREGDRSAVWFADLNADGIRDLLYGQVGGGLAFYRGIDDSTVSVFLGEPASVSLNIYPNPANETINVRFNEPRGSGAFSICDLSGRVILTHQVNSAFFTLDISSLSAGCYLCRMATNQGQAVVKLLIEK